MIPKCPKCGYDLGGLKGQVCPECGLPIDDPNLVREWDRRVSRRWSWFLMSPVLALPGLIVIGIGHPIAAAVLGTALAYRAFTLEDTMQTRVTTPFMRWVQSGLLAVTWTMASCVIMWATVFALAAAVLGL